MVVENDGYWEPDSEDYRYTKLSVASEELVLLLKSGDGKLAFVGRSISLVTSLAV